MLLTKINKINDASQLLVRFIADEANLEKDMNTFTMSSEDKLPLKIDNFFAFNMLVSFLFFFFFFFC